MTTVNWVQDGNGNYEVSSPEHLKQLMNDGSLYTDTGSPPASYWADGTSYIQTADIDLLSDSTDIKPIGRNNSSFQGDYDGGNYSISNWSYLDPNFTSTDPCEIEVGLFAYIQSNVIKNIRLTGIFDLKGFHALGGFLAGRTRSAEVSNIICDFDTGTTMESGASAGTINVGTIGGYTQSGSFTGIDVKGTIAFAFGGVSYVGGLVGVMRFVTASLITISATFSGLSGTVCGGFVAWMRESTISNSINAMTGDITASAAAGGVALSSDHPNSVTNIVNAMTGNITASGNAGGIIAEGHTGITYDSLFNYMAGNISGSNSGGIIGRAVSTSTVTNSINAMNGNVENSVRGTGTVSGSVTVNTNFGLTFTSNDSGTSTPLTGFLTIASFPDLPYFLLSGSDTVGNTYDHDFIFANVGGNNTYSTTHLVISGGVGTFQDGVNPPPPLLVTPRVSSILCTVTPVTGAIAYRLTSQETGLSIEKTANNDFTDLEQSIGRLVPETEYTIRLYSTSDGSVYTLVETSIVTTLVNSAGNYNKSDYSSNGKFDLSTLDDISLSLITDLMNDVFSTGDIMDVKVSGKTKKSTFVNRGANVNIIDTDAIVAPFSTDGGSGQNVSLTLSDTSIVTVAYNDTNEEVTIGLNVYNTGDVLVLDGKKVSIVDL